MSAVLRQASQLGLTFSARTASSLLWSLAVQKDLVTMERLYLNLLLYLKQPTRTMVFVMMKAFSEQQQHKKVLQYAEECATYEIGLSPSMQAFVLSAQEQGSTNA